MGRMPIWAIIVAGVVLLAGANFACWHFLIKPRDAELAQASSAYQTAKTTADTLEQVRAENQAAKDQWAQAQADFARLMGTRSFPISFNMPTVAMIALWREYRERLPKELEKFILASGVQLVSGTSFPAPPGTPPPTPVGGFLHIPETTLSLGVRGTMAQIERLYHSIASFKRVMTISSFGLSGQGDQLQAQVSMDIYVPVEVPPGTGAAAPTGGAGAMPGGMAGGAAGGPPAGG